MAIIGLSEFTFGYAFLFEQTTRLWNGLKAVPVLPSLNEEADLGWDAHLSAATDYYYQFKLSDYLYRGNAKFIRDGIYQAPYYRISLHSRDNNRQHRRLKDHAAAHPETYYVAPETRSLEEFNTSFLARQITDLSRIIPVTDCDAVADTDGSVHYITYQPNQTQWRFHSEPSVRERSYSGKNLQSVFDRARPKVKPFDTTFAETLYGTVSSAARRALDREHVAAGPERVPVLELSADSHTRRGFVQSAADIVSVVYGATLVLVGVPES